MNFKRISKSGTGSRKKIRLDRVYPEEGQGEGDRPLPLKDEPPKDLGLLFECKPDINIDSKVSVEENSPRIAIAENQIPIPISEVSERQQRFMINNVKKKYERKENPPNLYTQLLYGGVGPTGSRGRPKKKTPGEFLKKLGRRACCRERAAKEYFHEEIQREVDVGDEDEAIFTPRKRRPKKIKRMWRKLNTLKLLLQIFIVIDYLFAWFQYWRSRLGSAENEFTHLQDIYNCDKTPTSAGIGDQVIEVVRAITAFLSFLVLFASNEQNTTICAYWMGARWIQSLLHTLEYFWLTRFLNDQDLVLEFTWNLFAYLAFNAIGMFLVCLFYYEYSNIIKSRVNRLRGNRVLNREIDAKHLDEFSQRKAAVRYAGNYQSTLLIKKQIKEAMKDRGDPWDLRDPRPEECQFALEEGIRAYKYFRGIPILKIEETGQKIQRKIYLRRMKQMRESVLSEEARLRAGYAKLKATSASISSTMSSAPQ